MPFQPGSRWMEIEHQGGVTVVKLTQHSILDEGPIVTLGEQLIELVSQAEHPRFAVNFGMVARLSSSMLVQLINFRNKIKEVGGQLVLYAIDPEVHTVFAVTKLTTLFRIVNYEHEALEALKGP